jgi:hypothetical protein
MHWGIVPMQKQVSRSNGSILPVEQDQNILMQSLCMMAALMEHYTGRHFL